MEKNIMRFKNVLLLVPFVAVLVSCTKEPNPEKGEPFVKGEEVTLSIGIGSDNATRVSNSFDDGVVFKWDDGDSIKVSVGEEYSIFKMTEVTDGGARATFVGKMPDDGTSFDVQYPCTVPDIKNQKYVADGFEKDKMLLQAKNCSASRPISFTLTQANSAILLKVYGGTTLSRIVVVDTTSVPAVSYTLDCSNGGSGVQTGVSENQATPFLIVVPAGNYRFIVKLSELGTQNVNQFATLDAKTLKAGEILQMKPRQFFIPKKLDLNLSVYWASCNLGAVNPWDYGEYYTWGDPVSKNTINWKTYRFSNGEKALANVRMTKYCNLSEYGKDGYTDALTTLEPSDDAASVCLGDSWRMATSAEWDELKQKCKMEITTVSGVKCCMVTRTGYSDTLYLPFGGCKTSSGTPYAQGTKGYYLSSSLYTTLPTDAVYYQANSSSGLSKGHVDRYKGNSVRPVYPKQ